VDRAATTGQTLTAAQSISLQDLHEVLKAFGTGSCQERVEALWNLMDKDNDGLLDQAEMDEVVYMSVAPVEDAFRFYINDCLEVWPMRSAGMPSISADHLKEPRDDGDRELATGAGGAKNKLGFYGRWKGKREEKKARQIFLKMMEKAVKNHFNVEVETPHRLRCAYAWSEKTHQDGKVESVLVSDNNEGIEGAESDSSSSTSGFLSGGRKRYVELDPKISYEEFRAVQKEHFSHLDRVGEELCKSFKEEMWVHQGKGRQYQELKKESLAFLGVVTLIDLAIILN